MRQEAVIRVADGESGSGIVGTARMFIISSNILNICRGNDERNNGKY